jgi:hypothetical protein
MRQDGLPMLTGNSTWASVGGRKTSDPRLQILYGLRYIASRYGTPAGALGFHDRNNWYDSGGVLSPGLNLAWNGTGRREGVLDPDETSAVVAIGALAARINRNTVRPTGTAPGMGALVEGGLHVSVEDKRDLPDALAIVDRKLRVIRRGGAQVAARAQ